MNKQYKLVKPLSFALSLMVALASIRGMFTHEGEQPIMQLYRTGQEFISLFVITPFLLVTTLMVSNKIRYAGPVWCGLVLYIAYTYVSLIMAVPAGHLLAEYFIILFICIYLFIWYVDTRLHDETKVVVNKKLNMVTGLSFLILPVLFGVLFFLKAIPFFPSVKPLVSAQHYARLFDPVYITVTFIALPLLFLSGIFILRQNTTAMSIAPVLLTFFIFADLTIAILNIILFKNGIPINNYLPFIMCGFALLSFLLLLMDIRTVKKIS